MINLALDERTEPRGGAAGVGVGVERARVAASMLRPMEFLVRWRERQRQRRVWTALPERPAARRGIWIGGGHP